MFWEKCGNAGKYKICGISRTIAGWLTPMRMQYFLKKDDKSLIDVEHVETDSKLKWDCICLSIVDLFAEVTRFVRLGVYRVL